MSAFILLLSGDVFTCMSLEDEFELRGFSAQGTTNAEEARDLLCEHREEISGIICDSDFSYFEQRALFPVVPIVMLSSNGIQQDFPNHIVVMRKPVTPVEIVVTMKEILTSIEGHVSKESAIIKLAI